jgi:hypothetical protein
MAISSQQVAHFRTTLLWPLQIRPGFYGDHIPKVREALADQGSPAGWRLVDDEFTSDPAHFQERHYKEFITFLPAVQRFLYGEGRSRSRSPDDPALPAPVEVYRRHDVSALRVWTQEESTPVLLQVAHLDLYLFLDEDVVLLNLEVFADQLPLPLVLELLYRFGRAYPAGWEDTGLGHHNLARVEVVGSDGSVIAVSDAAERERYLRFVCEHRAPYVSAQWRCLLRPLVMDHGDEPGVVRFRQVEFYRMPMMVFLAMEDPRALSREDFIHITQVANVPPGDPIAPSDPILRTLETQYFYDRYWTQSESGPNTRFICTGGTLMVVGEAASAHFMDAERGVLAQFRHQHFVIFMIAHFHRAALLSFSDFLSEAVNDLNVRNPASVRRFKRRIWATFQNFLTFTHRYWFHQISELGHMRALFDRTRERLGTDDLYEEVRLQVRDMSDYLDSDSEREQSETVLRLTVVTVVGLIFSVVTGFFGMNLLALADEPLWLRFAYFSVGTAITIGLLLLTVARSRQIAHLLERVSGDRNGRRARGNPSGKLGNQGRL